MPYIEHGCGIHIILRDGAVGVLAVRRTRYLSSGSALKRERRDRRSIRDAYEGLQAPGGFQGCT